MSRAFTEDLLMACMRCGFCLPSCPTYRERQIETATPRGRIALMRAVHEGKADILDIAPALDLCLGCRACEPVCPAGVQYGAILEEGRAALAQARPNPAPVRMAYRYLLGTPAGIQIAGWLLWLYQVTRLDRLVRATGLVARLGGAGLAAMEAAMPMAASPLRRMLSRRRRTVAAAGPRRMRVGFFSGCVSDIAFFATNENAIRVLAAAGCEVTVVPGQGCCGAVHSHTGEHNMALVQAKRNIAAFEAGGFDAIVNTAGGCGAALKEYRRLLAGDPDWAERAARFSDACRDFSELLSGLPPLPLGPLPETLTYQDSCHLRNAQNVSVQPRRLLRSIPGATFVEAPEADRCCGAAGTYAATQPDMSDRILDKKMARFQATGATTVVVANPPCYLELLEGVQRAGLQGTVRVKHVADVLAEALDAGHPPGKEDVQ